MQRDGTLSQIMLSNLYLQRYPPCPSICILSGLYLVVNEYFLVIRIYSRGRGEHVANNPLKTFLY